MVHEPLTRPRLPDAALQSADAVLLVDEDGRIAAANAAAERLYGYTGAELEALSVRDLRGAPAVVEVTEFIARLTREIGLTYEVTHRRKSGTILHLEARVALFEEDGRRYASATLRDVSSRRAADERIALLQRALEQSPVSVMLTNPRGRIEYVNSRFCALTGYSQREVLGRNPRFLSAGLDAPETYRELWQAVLAGNEWRGVLRNRKKNGERYDELASISPVFDDAGRLTHILAVKEDITERRRAQTAIEESKNRLQNVIDSTPDWVYATDLEGKFLLANTSFAAALGMHPRDLVGRPVALLDGLRIDGETFRAPDGGARVFDTFVVPLRNKGDEVYGTLHFGRDVTASKAAAHEHALIQMELQQAQKLESIGRLAAGIAHEINTPIQYVGDNVRFLQDSFESLRDLLAACEQLDAGGGDPATLVRVARSVDAAYLAAEIPSALQQTLEGVQRVSAIVHAMKDFSHRGAAEMAPTDLNRAVESTVMVARNEWKYVADMALELEPDLPVVTCLAGEIKQVILNLVINAAHAIGSVVGDGSLTKGRITIRTRRSGAFVELAVQDSGGGIPESIRDKIFEPFFTTKPLGQGTGQGLTLARSVVVDRHKGTLQFETAPGTGTTFLVRLPVGGPDA